MKLCHQRKSYFKDGQMPTLIHFDYILALRPRWRKSKDAE